MWRLSIWQRSTIGRVFVRAAGRTLASMAGASPRIPAGYKRFESLAQEGETEAWRGLTPVTIERDAAFWRKLDEEARTIAALMAEPEHGRRMLLIADLYRFLADRADVRKNCKNVIRGSRQHLALGAQDTIEGMSTLPTLERAPAQLRERSDELAPQAVALAQEARV
jgi:hypothetical protein